MATPSRSRSSAGARRPGVTALVVGDALRTWIIPAAAALAVVAAAGLGVAEAVAMPRALLAAVAAALVLLAWLAVRPVLAERTPARARILAGAVVAGWLLACYDPFHLRLYPGTPIVDRAEVAPARGLPLRIPAAGHRRLGAVLEGRLPKAPTGAGIPVHYTITVQDPGGGTQTLAGRFDDAPRLVRPGAPPAPAAPVAQAHGLANPSRQDLAITAVTLEPADAPPVVVTVHADPLPPGPLLAIAAMALLAAAVAFDRRGPVAATDGALTVATAAVLGTAYAFCTSNTAHPDVRTLVGATLLGGSIGFAAGAAVWWAAKRLVAPAGR
jgi:hypothetical protein